MEEFQSQLFLNYQIIFAALIAKARFGKLDLGSLRELLWQGFNLNNEDYERIKELEDTRPLDFLSELKNLRINYVLLEDIKKCFDFYFRPDYPTQIALKTIQSTKIIDLNTLERRVKTIGFSLPEIPMFDYLSFLKLGYKKENMFFTNGEKMKIVWDFL